MRRVNYFGYLALGFALLTLLSVPPKKFHRLRSSLIGKALSLESATLHRQNKIQKLKESISKLREENATLKNQVSSSSANILNLKSTNSTKVIFRDPAFWSSSVLVNAGINSKNVEIERNSPVLSNGFLVGLVEEVFDQVSKVRLISDKNLQVSVKRKYATSQDNEDLNVGTLFGISSIKNRYRFKHVEGIFFSKELKVGDVLITSGLDGIFPENLPVAQVTDVTYDQEEVSYPFKATILAPDIKDLKYVTILTPLIGH